MRSRFPLFQSHLDLAHLYWKELIQKGEIVIDATCGNGHDTLKLCQLVLSENSGFVHAFDIQKEALEKTERLVCSSLPEEISKRLILHHASHATFPDLFKEECFGLVVYNLGYLPGGEKSITTKLESTLSSIREVSSLLRPGGAISVTCYPGHKEGEKEEKALLDFFETFAPKEWSCCHHRWVNRREAPSLLLIQKRSL